LIIYPYTPSPIKNTKKENLLDFSPIEC